MTKKKVCSTWSTSADTCISCLPYLLQKSYVFCLAAELLLTRRDVSPIVHIYSVYNFFSFNRKFRLRAIRYGSRKEYIRRKSIEGVSSLITKSTKSTTIEGKSAILGMVKKHQNRQHHQGHRNISHKVSHLE